MIESFYQAVLSNTAIALILALLAFLSHYIGKKPLISHALWLLVLIKLVTPPIFTLPILPADINGQFSTPMAIESDESNALVQAPGLLNANSSAVEALYNPANLILLIWGIGSLCVLGISVLRIIRFNHFLNFSSTKGAVDLQGIVADIAHQLQLKTVPTLVISTAKLSPMVWWTGGKVKVVIPEGLIQSASQSQLQWVIAHELVHVKRFDHMVRWLELFASVCYWWNPLTWLARRNLRIFEEICCDKQVLSTFQPKPKTYANALMTAVEYLSTADVNAPAVASGIGSDGSLEKRFRMIISSKTGAKHSRWLTITVIVVAACLLPLGFGFTAVSAEESNQLIGVNDNNVITSKVEIEPFNCDEDGYEYLVDLVHGKTVAAKQGLYQWEAQCGEDSGERIDKSGKQFGLPQHHLKYMADNDSMTNMPKNAQAMWRMLRKLQSSQ